MKITETDIKKIESLVDAWEVQMPDDRFFVNLPAKVLDGALKPRKAWWSRLPVPIGAAAAAALILAFGIFLAGREARGTGRLMLAAAEWSSESADWEGIDQVLAEAQNAGISDLHRYLDASGLESAASAVDQYANIQSLDYALDSDQ